MKYQMHKVLVLFFLVLFGSAAWAGATAQNNQNATSTCDSHDSTKCGESSGMPTYSFSSLLAGLSLRDTPLSYMPPAGSKLAFSLYYNAREANQPDNFQAVNLGPKWTLNWISYIQDDPNAPGQRVKRYIAGGGARMYYGFDQASGRFDPQSNNAAVLVRVSTNPIVYELRFADGSKSVFAESNNSNSYPRKIFLSKRVDAQGNVISLDYDAQMRLLTVTDAIGQTSHFHYDNTNYPLAITGVTGPFGLSFQLDYDSQGRLVAITDAIGMTSTFSYEGAGTFISAMTTPYGTTHFHKTRHVGSSTQSSILATGPLGYTERTEFRHNAPGIPFSTRKVPDGIDAFNAYLNYRNSFYWNKLAFSRACTLTADGDANCDYTKARIKHYLHDAHGSSQTSRVLESVKEPLENRVWFNYPGQSWQSTTGSLDKPKRIGRVLEDGSTQLIKRTYNDRGQVTREVDPTGRTTRYTYATNGIDLLKVERKTANGWDLLKQYSYNNQHQPLTVTNAAGQVTTFTYNAVGQITSVTDPLGHTTGYEYNDEGYLVRITNALGHLQNSFTYDAHGRVASVTDSEGYRIEYQYDALNRITRIAYPDGTSRSFVWDKLDLVAVTDREGRTTTYEYDAGRNLIAKTDPMGGVTHYTYYPGGKLKSLTDPNGNTTTWQRDIQGRIVGKTYADGQGVTFAYDATGRLISKTDALGQVTHYSYTLGDLLSGINYTQEINPTPAVSFSYGNSYPRLVAMVDGTGITQYAYYPAGGLGANHLASIDGPGQHDGIQYTYDELGRLVSRVVSGSTENFAYDALGRLVSNQNGLGDFTYRYLGDTRQMTKQTIAGVPYQVVRQYAGNLNDRHLKAILNQSLVGGSERPVANFQFNISPSGQITHRSVVTNRHGIDVSWNLLDWLLGDLQIWWHEEGASVDYQYDANQRLVAAQGSDTDFAYGYDAAGNLTQLTHDNQSKTITANALNQAGSVNQTQYVYDANGNLLEDSKRIYTWDAANRLLSITNKTTGHVTTFAYDGFSRRISRTESDISGSDIVTYNIWCSMRICEQHLADGTVVARYYKQGELHAGTAYYYAQDQVGSVVAMVDANGQVAGRTTYGPYGQVIAQSGVQPNYAYAGLYRHQASGLYLATYRAYDPATARWIKRDPIKEAGGINLYGYVAGNPVSSTDASGLILDTIADVGFILYDLYRIGADNVFGDCDNLGTNLAALGADAAATVTPFVTGAGLGVRAARSTISKLDDAIALYNKNDIHHLFGRGGDTPQKLLEKFGSPEAALRELQKSAQGIANNTYQTGSWVTVMIDNVPVSIKGKVIDGTFRISTIAKKGF